MTYDPYAHAPTPPPQKRKTGKILGLGCAGLLGLTLFGSCVAAVSSDSADKKTASASPPSASRTGKSMDEEFKDIQERNRKNREEMEKESREEAAKDGEFGDGDYQVGVDIQPGTYVSTGAEKGLFEFCSASTDPTDGSFGELESAGADEQVILTVTEDSGVVSISGCEPFVLRK